MALLPERLCADDRAHAAVLMLGDLVADVVSYFDTLREQGKRTPP